MCIDAYADTHCVGIKKSVFIYLFAHFFLILPPLLEEKESIFLHLHIKHFSDQESRYPQSN